MWKAVLGRTDKSEASSSRRKDESRSQDETRSKRKDSVKDSGRTREKRDSESVMSTTTRGTNRGIDPVSSTSGNQLAQADNMDDSPRTRGLEDEKKTRRRGRSNSRERTYRRDRSRSEERVKNDKKEKKLKRRSTDTGAFSGESSRAIENTGASKANISNHVPDMFPGQFPSGVSAPYRPPLSVAEGGPGLASEYYNTGGDSWQQRPANAPTSSNTVTGNQRPATSNIAPQISAAAAGAAIGAASSYMMNTHSEQSSTYQVRPSGAPYPTSTASVSNNPSRPVQQSSSSNVPYAIAAGAAGGIAAGAYYNHTHEHSGTYSSAPNYSNSNNYGMAQQQRPTGPLDTIVNFFKDPEGVARYEEYSEAVGICRGCFEPGSTPYQAPRRHGYKGRRSSERLRPSRVEKDNRYHSSSDEGKRRSNKSMLGAAAAGIGLGAIGRTLLGDFDDTYSVKSGKPAPSNSIPYRSSPRYQAESIEIRDDDRSRKSKKVEYSVSSSGAVYEERNGTNRNKSDTITVEQSEPALRSRDRNRIQDVVAGAAIGAAAAEVTKRRERRGSTDEVIRVKYRSRSRSRERKSRKAESPTQSTSIFGNFFSSPSSSGKRKKNKNKGFFTFSNGSSSSDSSLAFGASDRDRRRRGKRSSPRIKTTAEANAALIGLGTATAALAAYESRNRKPSKHVPAVVAVKSKGKQDYYRDSQKRHATMDDGWESAPEDSDSGIDSELAFGSPFNQSRESLTASGTDKWDWRWGQKKRRSSSPRRDTDRPTSGFASAASAGVAGAAVGAIVGQAVAKSHSRDDREYSSSGTRPLQYVEPVSTSDPRRYDATGHDPVTGQVPYRSRPDPVPIQQPQPIVPVPEAVYTTSIPGPRTATYSNDEEYRKRDADNAVVIQPRSQRAKEENVRFDLSNEQEERYRNEKYHEDQRSDKFYETDDRKRDHRGQELVIETSTSEKTNGQRDAIEVIIEPGQRRRTWENREIHHTELEDDHLAELHRELEKMKAMAKPQSQQQETSAGTIAGLGMAGIAAAAVAVESSRRKASDEKVDNYGSSKNQSNDDVGAVTPKKSGGFAGLVDRISKAKDEETSQQDKKSEAENDGTTRRSLTRKSTTTRIARSQSPVAHESYAAYFAPDDILSHPSKAKETNPDPNADVELSSNGDRRGRTVKGRYGEPEYPKIENEIFDPIESHQSLPWPVPRLGLINPTPIPSRANSRNPSPYPSPTVQPTNPEATEVEKDSHDNETETSVLPPDHSVNAPREIHETTTIVGEPSVIEEHSTKPVQIDPPAEITSPVEEIHRTSIPGSFEDDIDFAATLAAGAAAAGFDPDIVIEDSTYRRRDSPPGSQTREFYKQPSYQTVSDIAIQAFGGNSPPQQQGFIVGEVPDTPKEESSSLPENLEKDAKASRKEQRKKDKAKKRAKEDVAMTADVDDSNVPDTLEDEHIRDSTELEIIEDMARDTQTEPDTPVSKKSKKKSKRNGTSDFASAAIAAMGGAAMVETIDGVDNENTKKSKKESKKSNGFDFASIAMEASKDTPKTRTVEPNATPEFESRDKTIKEELQDPAEVVLSAGDADSFTSFPTATKTQSIEEDKDEVDDVFDSSNEYAVSAYNNPPEEQIDEDTRKHKRKSKRRSKTFDDAASTVSTQSKSEDKKESGKKKGGLFGLFGKSSSNDPGEKQQPTEAQEEDFEPVEVNKKKKKSRKSREIDEASSVASAPVSELTKADQGEDDRKSRRRRSRKGTQDEDDSGRATQDLPDKDDYDIIEKSDDKPDEESFLGERREKLKPPDIDTEYQDQSEDEIGSSSRQYSDITPLVDRPSTPPKIDWIKDDAFTPKDVEKHPSQLSMIHSSANYSPATPSPTAVPLIFRKPPSLALSGAKPSSTTSSPALTTPKSRKPRPQSAEFRSNEFRPLWLVSRYGPKQEVDPEEVYPSLPSSHSNSRSSSVHEDDQEHKEISKPKFSGKSIDIAAASAASQDILDSAQVTPTATSYRSKREQDLLDEARHEAVARELEWVQRTSPEYKRRSQEYQGDVSTSPTRESIAGTGLAMLAGATTAAAVTHSIPKTSEQQNDVFQDVSEKSVAPTIDKISSDMSQALASTDSATSQEEHKNISEDDIGHRSLSEGPPAISSFTDTESSRDTIEAHENNLAQSAATETVDDEVQKVEEDPTLEFTPKHTLIASDSNLDKNVPVVESTPTLTTSNDTLISTVKPDKGTTNFIQVDLPSEHKDIPVETEDDTSPIRSAITSPPEESVRALSEESSVVERDVGQSLPSFSTSYVPRLESTEHTRNTNSESTEDYVDTTIEKQSLEKESALEQTRQVEPDSFERLTDPSNESTNFQRQSQISEPEASAIAPHIDPQGPARETIMDIEPAEQDHHVPPDSSLVESDKALALAATTAGAVAIGDIIKAHEPKIESPLKEEPIPTDEWSSSWTSKKGKKKKKKANSSWIESPQETKDIPTEDIPAEDVPTEDFLTRHIPAEEIPAEDVLTKHVSAEDVPVQDRSVEQKVQDELSDFSAGSSKRKSVTFLENPVSGEHYVTAREQDISADETEFLPLTSDAGTKEREELFLEESEQLDREQSSIEDTIANEPLASVDSHETPLATDSKAKVATANFPIPEPSSLSSDLPHSSSDIAEPLPKDSSDSGDMLLIGQSDLSRDALEDNLSDVIPAESVSDREASLEEISNIGQHVSLSHDILDVAESHDGAQETALVDESLKEITASSAEGQEIHESTQDNANEVETEFSQYTGKKSKKNKGKKKKQEESFFKTDEEPPTDLLISQTALDETLTDTQDLPQLSEKADTAETANQTFTEVDFRKSKSKKSKRLAKQQRSAALEDEPTPEILENSTVDLPEEDNFAAVDDISAPDVSSVPEETQSSQDVSFATKTKKQKKKKRQAQSWDLVDEPNAETESSSLINETSVGESRTEPESRDLFEDLRATEDPQSQIVSGTPDEQQRLIIDENQFPVADDKPIATVSLLAEESFVPGPVPEDRDAEESFSEKGKKKKKGKKKTRSLTWTDEPEPEDVPRELETGSANVTDTSETHPAITESDANILEDDQGVAVEPPLAAEMQIPTDDIDPDTPLQKQDRAVDEEHQSTTKEASDQLYHPETELRDSSEPINIQREGHTAVSINEPEPNVEQLVKEPDPKDHFDSPYTSANDNVALTNDEHNDDQIRQETNSLSFNQHGSNDPSHLNTNQLPKHAESDTIHTEQNLALNEGLKAQQDTSGNDIINDRAELDEQPNIAPVAPEDEWEFNSKASKKDKKKKKKQQNRQVLALIDDEVEAKPVTPEITLDRNGSIDTPASEALTEEPISESNEVTDGTTSKATSEDHTPASQGITSTIEEDNWAVPTKKSKKNKKGRQSRTWDTEVVESPAEDSALTRHSTTDTSEKQLPEDNLYAEDNPKSIESQDNVQSQSRLQAQDEDSKKSSKAAKGKKKGKKVNLSSWEEEATKADPTDDYSILEPARQETINHEDLAESTQHTDVATAAKGDDVDISLDPETTVQIPSNDITALPSFIADPEGNKMVPILDDSEHVVDHQNIGEINETRVERALSPHRKQPPPKPSDLIIQEAGPGLAILSDENYQLPAQPSHDIASPAHVDTETIPEDIEDKLAVNSKAVEMSTIVGDETEVQQSKGSKKKKKNKKTFVAWEPEAEEAPTTPAIDLPDPQSTSPVTKPEELSTAMTDGFEKNEVEAVTSQPQEAIANIDEPRPELTPKEDENATKEHVSTIRDEEDLQAQADTTTPTSLILDTSLTHQLQDTTDLKEHAYTDLENINVPATSFESDLEQLKSEPTEELEQSVSIKDKNAEDDLGWSGFKKTKKSKKNRRSTKLDVGGETVPESAQTEEELNNAPSTADIIPKVKQTSFVQENDNIRNLNDSVELNTIPGTKQQIVSLEDTIEDPRSAAIDDDFGLSVDSKEETRQLESTLVDDDNEAELTTYKDKSTLRNEPEQEKSEFATASNQDPTIADDDLIWSSSKKAKKGKKKRQSALQRVESASDQTDKALTENLEIDDTALPEILPNTEDQLPVSTVPIAGDYFASGSRNSDLRQEEEPFADANERENIKEGVQQSLDDGTKEAVEEDDFAGWATTKKAKKGKKGKKGSKKEQKSFDEDPTPSQEIISENPEVVRSQRHVFLDTDQPISRDAFESEQIEHPAYGTTSELTGEEMILDNRDMDREVELNPLKAKDLAELSQPAFQDEQTKEYQDFENVLQRSNDESTHLQHDGELTPLQYVHQQTSPAPLEKLETSPSGEFWEAPAKKKGKKGKQNKQKTMIVAAAEQDIPGLENEETFANLDVSTNNETSDILGQTRDSFGRELYRNTEILDPEATSHPSPAIEYPQDGVEYTRSTVDEPADIQDHLEQIDQSPSNNITDNTQDVPLKARDKTSKRKFGSEDTENQKAATRDQDFSQFEVQTDSSKQGPSLAKITKSASKVGAGIAIFEGIQRATSMSEDQPPKKNRKTSKEVEEALPAVFDDQEHSSSDHQHEKSSNIHPLFRDSALHMDSPVSTSNRESIRDSRFQDADPTSINVSVEVDPHYDVVISSPADANTTVDHIHTEPEIRDHRAQALSSRERSPMEEQFPVTTKMQEISATSSSPTQDGNIHDHRSVNDSISTSPVSHNESIFGGQIGHSSDRDFNSLRSPPMTPTGFSMPHQPLMTIAEASPDDVKRTHSPSELEHNPSRRSGTRRLKSPNPENPRRLGLISSDDLISRLSWPEFDEEGQAIHVAKNTSQTATRDQKVRPISHIDTTQSLDRRSISGNSIESNESINAIIRSPPPTATPPLRRVDRSLSGDLRLSNRRQGFSPTAEENNAKLDLSKENKRHFDSEILGEGIPSSSTYDPLKDKGKGRSTIMADVYEGYGDMGGSPQSPTRPNSVRRRQSLQIMDLETRLKQLLQENRTLLDAKHRAERNLEQSVQDSDQQNQAHRDAILTRDQYLQQKDEELVSLKQTLQTLQDEVARLGDANRSITGNEQDDWRQHYEDLMADHTAAREQLEEQSTELEELKNKHTSLSGGMEAIVANEVRLALQSKDTELEQIRSELVAAKQQVRQLQLEIMAARREGENTIERDEDYFEAKCEDLCKQVQQFVLRYSKFSDMRICRTMAEVQDEKITDRFDTSILDGTDVDVYLADRIKRRDVFMSVTMSLMWEYIFTRYLFGMDREQRQKLKYLEKTLLEVGPPAAVNKWRATTLTMLSRREAFQAQREQDTEAVVSEILRTLGAFLPPPANLREQITDSLRKVVSFAVDLSVEMRTQKAEYIMLPPLQPQYNLQGDLETMVHFNAATMNERSGNYPDNTVLEEQEAVVRVVLFPLVIKQGDSESKTNEQEVICQAQVLIADNNPNEISAGRKNVRTASAQENRSVQSFAPSNMEGGMI